MMLLSLRNCLSRTGPAWVLGLLMAGLFSGWLEGAERTNVVLITIDTLRADRLGAYGYPLAKTPVIDQLASEGALFEDAIVQTPITLPSHASILTSTYPMYHGLQDVIGRLRKDVPTLAEWFEKRGYATGAFVGASVLMGQWGLDRGFQVYEDHFQAALSGEVDFDRVERPAGEVVDLATEWVKKVRAKRFFLWLHLYDPHDPYQPPEPFATEFKDRPYDGEIAYADAMLGKLIRTLREYDLYDSTLIVLTADHGEMLGEHGEAFHAFFIYQSALHVPLIVRVPKSRAEGLFEAGSRIPNQVRSIDIFPTIVELLGEPVPEGVQGKSLVNLLAGKAGSEQLPAYSETHYPRIHFSWSPLFSYSDGRYKYIDAPIPELYDLQEDPGEKDNLFSRQEALADQLKDKLYALQREFVRPSDASSDREEQIDPKTVERLKALGYVAFSSGSDASSPDLGARLDLPDPKLKIQTYNALNRGIALSRAGHSQQALAIFQRLSKEEPEMPIVHFLLGMEFFTGGQYLLAVEQFQETLKRNPESNVARYNLARSYARSGLAGRAKEVIGELLQADPSHFAARHLLATILSSERRFEEAIAEESKVLELQPEFPEALNNLGSYYLNLGRVEEAIGSYKKAIELAPNQSLARENLILAYLAQKNYEEALKESETVLKLNPQSSLAYFYSGQAYLAKGMKEEAEKAFQKAKALNPNLNVPRE